MAARPTLNLSGLLGPSTPPRSPHTRPPGLFDSYFGTGTDGKHTTSHNGGGGSSGNNIMSGRLRPTRRDVLLCLLTLSLGYLLFSSPPADEVGRVSYGSEDPAVLGGSSPATHKSGFSFPGWSSSSRHQTQVRPAPQVIGASPDVPISEANRPVKFQSLDAGKGAESEWEQGEEELSEDDGMLDLSTVKLGHSPGWTMMDRPYIYNGSLYVVTDDRASWPELQHMTSTGLPAMEGNGAERYPRGDEIIFITPKEAAKLWEGRVYRISGTTLMINDGQFLDHYYHFVAELFLGIWRTYASLDQRIGSRGETSLASPKRMWLLHQSTTDWRDNPRFNPGFLNVVFPSMSFRYPQDWEDMRRQTIAFKPTAYMLDRVVYTDRSAAFYGDHTAPVSRTVAEALHIGKVSQWWWEPIRRAVLRYSGVTDDILDRNLEGIGAVDPVKIASGTTDGVVLTPQVSQPGDYVPLVVYISRQSSRRRLIQSNHEELVAELEKRAQRGGFELKVVEAEKLSQPEQYALAGKATIMLGVHGNGLTHLLWMPPTPRSAVIEMFYRGGFARDYQWTAHALGIRHYGVNHDVVFTSPNLPEVDYPEGFQGESITVDPKTVANLIEDHLAGRSFDDLAGLGGLGSGA